jgi:electron transfer flavoprotein alpha subunit
MNDHNGVMVFCEVGEGNLLSIATELLSVGRKLADELGEVLCAVLMGEAVSALAEEVIAFGADKVYVVEDTQLKDYQNEVVVSAMESVVTEALPKIILLGQTGVGRDTASRLAFRLETAASLNCIDLAIDSETRRLLQTKQVYGGNAQVVFVSESDPQIVTVRPKSFVPLERNDVREGEVKSIDAGLDASSQKVKVVGRFQDEVEGIKLEDADVVVTGGRGMGKAEGFKQLEELARLLKGAVGATRPPCDDGWVPTGRQIGITGKTVTPKLYVAVGVSGAPQHLCAAGAKHLVAINKDEEANIFKAAHYGVVGDWKRVLPAFKEKLSKLLEG